MCFLLVAFHYLPRVQVACLVTKPLHKPPASEDAVLLLNLVLVDGEGVGTAALSPVYRHPWHGPRTRCEARGLGV